MNKFLISLFLFCVISSTINASNNFTSLTKIKDFSMGLAIGMGALANMPDAVTCVTDAGSLITDIEALIKEIENNPEDIFDIIKKIGNIS